MGGAEGVGLGVELGPGVGVGALEGVGKPEAVGTAEAVGIALLAGEEVAATVVRGERALDCDGLGVAARAGMGVAGSPSVLLMS